MEDAVGFGGRVDFGVAVLFGLEFDGGVEVEFEVGVGVEALVRPRAAISSGTSKRPDSSLTRAAMATLRRDSEAESKPRAVSSRRSRPGARSPA